MYSGGLKESKNTLQTFEGAKKHPGLYWDQLEIAFKLFRLIGYIPYKVSDEHDKIESSIQAWLWVGFASFVQVVIVVIHFYMHSDDKYWDTYDKTMESLIRLLHTNNAILILATWWESNKIIKYINVWPVFLGKLETITSSSVTCFLKYKFRRILISTAIVTMAAILLDQFMLLGDFSPFLLITYFINIYANALFTIFWAVNCLFIVQVAKSLKNHFFIALTTKSDHSIIDEYRLLWIQLRQNAVNLAESFKGTVGLLIFMNLLSLIFSIYTLMATALYTRNTTRMIALVLPVAGNSFTLLMICEFSDKVSREIGQKLISEMLSFNLCTQNYELMTSQEMDSLFNTLDANSPDFVLHGCLTLNRSLLITMISSTITYIIVLVQFNASGNT